MNPNFSSNLENNEQKRENDEQKEEQEKKDENNIDNKKEEENKEEEGKNEEENKEEEGIPEEDNNQLTPQEELNKFLEQHPDLGNLYKMLKMGVPIVGVMQKATINQLNMDNVNELIEIAKKIHSNIG